MEENPPKQSSRPTSREVPRSRDPRAPFGAPEQPEAKPAERPARRSGAKAAPPVTFQPPSGDTAADQPRAPSKATPRPKPPTGTPAKATPARSGAPKATPAKAASTKTTPAKTAPTKAAPAKTTATKAAPAKAGRTKAADRSAPVETTPASETPPTVTPAATVWTPAEHNATVSGGVDSTPTSVTPEAPRSDAPRSDAPQENAPWSDAPQENAPWSDAAVLEAAAEPVAPEVSTPQAPQDTAKADDVAKADETAAEGDATAVVRAAAVQVRRTVTDTWARVAADPTRTPELLALTAVQTIGPRAAEWARRVRESYPTASADGVARLAVRQFTRRGSVSSALAAVSGVYAPAALVGTAAYHHAELVLHVAAAYGLDPADPARAAELLVLTRVHASHEDAQAALAPTRRDGGSATTRRLGRTLAAQAGGWAALRAVSRRFPGVALLVTAVTSHAATETLGVRAVTHYRAAAR